MVVVTFASMASTASECCAITARSNSSLLAKAPPCDYFFE